MWYLKLCVASLIALFFQATAPRAETIDGLFHITKRQNRNQVHYAGNVTNCRWNTTNPIHAYWRMLENAPTAREELLPGRETKYFGYNVEAQDERVLSIQIGAFKAVPTLSNLIIRITLSGDASACQSRAMIDVDGATIRLTHMHADYGIWGLNAVEFHGTDHDGRPIKRRVEV